MYGENKHLKGMVGAITKSSIQMAKGCWKTVIIPDYVGMNDHNYHNNDIDKA